MDIFKKLAEIFTEKLPDSGVGVPYMAEDEAERDKDARTRFVSSMKERKKKARKQRMDDIQVSTLERTPHSDATNTRVNAKDIPLRGL